MSARAGRASMPSPSTRRRSLPAPWRFRQSHAASTGFASTRPSSLRWTARSNLRRTATGSVKRNATLRTQICGIRWTPSQTGLEKNRAYYGWILHGLELYAAARDGRNRDRRMLPDGLLDAVARPARIADESGLDARWLGTARAGRNPGSYQSGRAGCTGRRDDRQAPHCRPDRRCLWSDRGSTGRLAR